MIPKVINYCWFGRNELIAGGVSAWIMRLLSGMRITLIYIRTHILHSYMKTESMLF